MAVDVFVVKSARALALASLSKSACPVAGINYTVFGSVDHSHACPESKNDQHSRMKLREISDPIYLIEILIK